MITSRLGRIALFLIFFLQFHPSIHAASRSIYDQGAVWEGDWLTRHLPIKTVTSGDYTYILEETGIRLLKHIHLDNGRITNRTVDLSGESSTQSQFLVSGDRIIYYDYPMGELVFAERQEDQLVVQEHVPFEPASFYQLVADTMMLTNRGFLSIQDPNNPEFLWESDEIVDGSSAVVENRLFRINENTHHLYLYDISDITNPMPLDSISRIRLGGGSANRTYVLGKSIMYKTKELWEEPGLFFTGIDDNNDLLGYYWWSWWDNTSSHAPGSVLGLGVLNDTLFAAFNFVTSNTYNEPNLILFNPNNLPDNPEVGRYWYPDIIDNDHYAEAYNISFCDSLLVINSSSNDHPSLIINLKDPENPVRLYNNYGLPRDILSSVTYLDDEDNIFVFKQFKRDFIPEPMEYKGLMMVDFRLGMNPDTIGTVDDFYSGESSNWNTLEFDGTTLLTRPPSRDRYELFRSIPGQDDYNRAFIFPDQMFGYCEQELFKIGLRQYALIGNDSRLNLYRLNELDAVRTDTISMSSNYVGLEWFDAGLFVATRDSLRWFWVDDEDHLELIDAVATPEGNIAMSYFGGKIGVGAHLYDVSNGQLELLHNYPEDSRILALSRTRIVYQEGQMISVAEFSGGDYENRIAQVRLRNVNHAMLYGDLLWLMGDYSYSRYTLTGSMDLGDSWAGNRSQPASYGLLPAWPNPFNASTHITVRIPTRSEVTLSVYNLLGREVTRLHHGPITPGLHTYPFNASGLGSGVYFVQMNAGDYRATQKILLIK